MPTSTTVGDVTPVACAYGFSMASNYNMVPRAAVVFVENDEVRLTTRREILDDLFAREILSG